MQEERKEREAVGVGSEGVVGVEDVSEGPESGGEEEEEVGGVEEDVEEVTEVEVDSVEGEG